MADEVVCSPAPAGSAPGKSLRPHEDEMRGWDKIALAGVALAIGIAAGPRAAPGAEAYPSRPITIIVPFGAGSGTDIITRIIAQPLGIALNQNIVIDNRGGANGGTAAGFVGKGPRGGHH